MPFQDEYGGVVWIEPVRTASVRTQWARQDLDLDQDPDVLSMGVPSGEWSGTDQIVTVIDSGLDVEHDFFVDAHHDVPYYYTDEGCPVLQLRPSNHRKVVGYVRVAAYRDLDQVGPIVRGVREDRPSFHGTHVVGSIVGDPQSATNEEFRGLSPKARVLFFDIGSDSSQTIMHVPEDVSTMFHASYSSGSRIGSISWGTDENGYTELCRQIDTFLFEHDDFLLVVAAGNDGRKGNNTVGSPATCKNVFAVGASGNAWEALEWTREHPESWGDSQPPNETRTEWEAYRYGASPFSSRGWTRDGRAKPDCLVPGGPVISASAKTSRGLVAKYGTSQAAPLVAAAAANWREWGKQRRGLPTMSSALVRGLLVATTRGLHLNQVSNAPDRARGFGRCTLLGPNAIDENELWMRDDVSIGPLSELVWCLRVSSWSDPLSIVLSWTDRPSSPAATSNLLNDLDLRVEVNNWIEYGNDNLDLRNTIERVILRPQPTNQTSVRIRVRTRHLVDKLVRFALVVKSEGTTDVSEEQNGCVHSEQECVPQEDGMSIGEQQTNASVSTCRRKHCLPNAYLQNGRCRSLERDRIESCPKESGQGLVVEGNCRPSQCAETYELSFENGQCQCTRAERCAWDAPPSAIRPCINGRLAACVWERGKDQSHLQPSLTKVLMIAPWIVLVLLCRSRRRREERLEPTFFTKLRPSTSQKLSMPWVQTDLV